MDKDDEIRDENAIFYRRAYRKGNQIDKITGRPTSRAFKPRPVDERKLSVNLASLTTPNETIGDIAKYCLWAIKNSIILKIGLTSIYNPNEDNKAHCLISGFEEDDESKAGLLARNAQRVDI